MDSGTGVSGSAWRGLIWSLWVAAFAAAIIFAPITAQAQSATGRILGNVHDQSGAAIVGATVTITDIQRGVSRTLTTDQAGDYLAPNLVAGMYEVKAEAKGFEAIDRRNIQLEVATDARIDFQLLPGEATQTVVVTAETPMLDSTSSTLGGTLSNQIINDLPLNGRNYENLLQLRPEVVSYPGGGLSTHSSNGVRPEDNMFFVDGLENVEPFTGQSIINGGTLAGDAATILPIDAIQEFNLQANPAAEYGWKPGAVVNVGLKSGTNSLHGTAYAFGRDDAFGARNYYNPVGTPQTPLSLQQFGTTVGGPIIRNKLFFFGAYEGQRYTVGNSYGISVPETLAQSTPDPKNSMPDAITGLATAGVPISPVSLKLAGCTLGPPVTCTGNVFGPNSTSSPNINSGFPNTQSGDNGMGKIDYQLNSRNTISGLYFFGNSTGTLADKQYVLPQYLTLLHTRAQVANVNWTSTPNSTWVNEVRFGYNRLYNPIFP
ncbi:MAG: carboxypeptidase-like regulatory domain-containing protein, partial [Candidatus Acidiferrales bacterium]